MWEQQINLNPITATKPLLNPQDGEEVDDDKIQVDLLYSHTTVVRRFKRTLVRDYRLLRVQYGSYHLMGNLAH